MATEVVMPRLSDTMESGTIARWLKHEGDQVKRGDILAEIETDKANMELEAYANGVFAVILVDEGQSANLGQPIAMIAADQDEARKLKSEGPPGGAPASKTAPTPSAARLEVSTPGAALASGEDRVDQDLAPQDHPAPAHVGKREPNERIKASPLARRLASEHDVDLGEIDGSGPAGRITKVDVQSYLGQAGSAGTAPEPGQVTVAPASFHAVAEAGDDVRGAQPVEMTRMRHTIARRLSEARFSAPDFLLTAEFDMTESRGLLKSIAGTEGVPRVGPNDLLVMAVASALTRHPSANAGWDADRIVQYRRINVGIAVATPGGGLVVPVVRDADRKTLGQIATETKSLIEKARTGKLAPVEREGGTFTISNLGMYGIDQFTSILNPPEACSLAVGGITPKPVVVDGEIAVRDRMRVTLTCDHRVINGAEGAEFLATLRQLIEHPVLMIL